MDTPQSREDKEIPSGTEKTAETPIAPEVVEKVAKERMETRDDVTQFYRGSDVVEKRFDDLGVPGKKPPSFEQSVREKAMQRLMEPDSDSKQTELPDGRLKIETSDEKTYYVKSVEDPNDPAIREVMKILASEFATEELPETDTLQMAIQMALAGNKNPDRNDYYMFELLTDGEGKPLGAALGLYAPLYDKKGNKTGKGAAMTGYIVVRKEHRGAFTSMEPFRRLVRDSTREAGRRGEKLDMITGECVTAVEIGMNRYGGYRCYLELQDGSLEELKYYQPPLTWNPETGEPTADSGIAAEHFMIGKTDGTGEVSKEDAMSSIRAFHDYVYAKFWPREMFASDTAFKKSRDYVARLQEKIEKQLERAKTIRLISKTERKKLIKNGTAVTEHTEADKE
jgi:hypothetical protein